MLQSTGENGDGGEKREEACALERTPCLSPELPLPTVENRELACVA